MGGAHQWPEGHCDFLPLVGGDNEAEDESKQEANRDIYPDARAAARLTIPRGYRVTANGIVSAHADNDVHSSVR